MSISEFDLRKMQARTDPQSSEPPSVKTTKREADLHNEILEYCRSKGWVAIRSIFGRKSTMLPEGCSDFIIVAENRVRFIEVKTKSKQTLEQQCFERQVEKLGHGYIIVHSIEEFAATMRPLKL